MRGIVWGYTFQDGVSKMKEIESNYTFMGYNIVNKISGKYSYQVQFDNGDIWKVARASESMRASRANVSYIDSRIPLCFVENIIKRCTYLPPYNAIHYFYPSENWAKEDEENETNSK